MHNGSLFRAIKPVAGCDASSLPSTSRYLSAAMYVAATWCHWPSLTFRAPINSRGLTPFMAQSTVVAPGLACNRQEEFPLVTRPFQSALALVWPAFIHNSTVMFVVKESRDDESGTET